MRLVAGVAGQPGFVVVLGGNLRKAFRAGAVHFVAADAQHLRIEFCGLDRAGVIRVLCKRAMTRFAVHAPVAAFILHIKNVGMTRFARLMTSEGNRQGSDLGHSVAAIMAELAEALGNKNCSRSKNKCETNGEEPEEPEQVPGVLELAHACLSVESFGPEVKRHGWSRKAPP